MYITNEIILHILYVFLDMYRSEKQLRPFHLELEVLNECHTTLKFTSLVVVIYIYALVLISYRCIFFHYYYYFCMNFTIIIIMKL